MKLYFVQADDADGENLDWFVVADNSEDAQALWAGTVGDSICESGEVVRIRIILDDVTGTTFDGPARRIGWESLAVVYVS